MSGRGRASAAANANPARALALDIAERIAGLGPVSVTRFFSGAALLAAGVQFGFVIRGSLYLRVGDNNRAAFEALGAKPFSYAGRSKQVTVASYYEAPSEIVEDAERLSPWAVEAHRAALAARRPGSPRRGGRGRRKPMARPTPRPSR